MSGLAQSFTNIKELGHGGFSTVYQASCRNIDAVVAIKAVARHCLIDNRRRSVFENELKIMEAVDHPFVVLFYNLVQDDDNFYIVMEHCTQSLASLVTTKHNGIPRDMLEKYVCQIASGLHYLHRHLLVLHRDLTLDNILLDANGDVKIADFGLGKALTESNELCDTQCGTHPYLAPELLRRDPYTEKVDIWQLGVVIYAMVFGHFPFCMSNEAKMISEIQTKTPDFPDDVDVELKDLILKLLEKDPELRPSIEQVLVHPWVVNSKYSGFTDWKFVLCQNLTVGSKPSMELCREIEMMGLSSENVTKLGTEDAMVYRILRRKEILSMIEDGHTMQDRFDNVCGKPLLAKTLPAMAQVQSVNGKNKECSVLGPVMGRLARSRASLDGDIPAPRSVGVRCRSPSLLLHQMSQGSFLAKRYRFKAKNRIV